MKIIPPRSRTVCLLIGSVLGFASLLSRSAAEEPTLVKRAPMIEIEARFVRATPEQMRAAVGTKLDGSGAVMLAPDEVEKALTSLKAEKSDFFGHSRAVTKSGRKARIESVRELRYPSEYEASKDDPTKFIPTAFKTKDVGVVLEFGPTVTPQNPNELTLDLVVSATEFFGFVDASLPAEKVKHNSAEELNELTRAAIPEGAKWSPIMPSRKVTTSQSIRSGHTWLYDNDQFQKPEERGKGWASFYLFITPRVIAPK
ncbi:MAG: hypothetical protein ACO1QR_07865 [Chthoniobacteraceae bacterium]